MTHLQTDPTWASLFKTETHTHTHWSMNFSDPNPLGEDVKNKNTDGLQY